MWDAAAYGCSSTRARALVALAIGAAEGYDDPAGAGDDDGAGGPRSDVEPEGAARAGLGTSGGDPRRWTASCANEVGETALHVAAWAGHAEVAAALVGGGADVSAVDCGASHVTPLHEVRRAAAACG